MMDNSRRIKAELYRKVAHVSLAVVLLLPFIYPELFTFLAISPLHFYLLLATMSACVNAIQIKRPFLRAELKIRLREARKKTLELILSAAFWDKVPLAKRFKLLAEGVEEKMRKFEDLVYEYIDEMEREYEKRSGYIGVTFAAVAVAFSYAFFGKSALYGILSLIAYDAISAIVGVLAGGKTLPYSRTTVKGCLVAALVYLIVLIATGLDLLRASLVTIVAALAEAYGVEDNLTLPVVCSFVAWILGC